MIASPGATTALSLYACCACSGAGAPSSGSSWRGPPATPPAAAAPASGAGDSLVAAGEAMYLRGQFDSASGVWRPALARARAARDSALEARLLTWLGLAAYRQGRYVEARHSGEQALALKQRLGSAAELSRSYNALGLLAWNQGRLSDATLLFEHAAGTARTAADQAALAKASNNLALVQTETGDFAGARAGFVAARDAGRALADARIEGGALTNLGMLDVQTGDPLAAIGSLEAARRLYRSIGYETGEQNALGQLGTGYAAMGEPRRALAALDTALRLARKEGLRQEEASNLELIAEVYRDAGDPRRSLQLYAEAKALNAELGLDVERGTDLRSEAEIHSSLGRPVLARRYASEALEVHQRAGARLQELRDHLLLGDLAARSGASSDARAHLRRADRLATELQARTARLETALAKARVADWSGDSRTVLGSLASTGSDLARGGYGTEWQAAMLAARAYARLGALDSAVSLGRRAVAAIERVRGNFGSAALRTSYVVDKAAAYEDLVASLLRLGRADEAFEVADGLRGRALLEHLATTADERRLATRTLRSLAESEALLRRIDLLTARQDALEETPPADRDPGMAAQMRHLAGEITHARSAYESLMVHVEEQDASGAALLGGRHASAAEVRGALGPGEALLEYLATAEGVLLFVVTRAGVVGVQCPGAPGDLESRARVARGVLARPPDPVPPDLSVLDSLYEALIAPAMRSGLLADVRRLTIVPHSYLTYLPFAALRNPVTRRYLIEDFTVVHLPSAASLPVLRASSPATGSRSPSTGRIDLFAPTPATLPGTRREATAIGAAVPGTRLYLAAQATEVRFRQSLASPAIVHLAGHGSMNPRNPMFSQVALAGGEPGGSGNDGRLEVHEVLGLRVHSPLVFLSGCETGVGAEWSTGFARGEDYTTMAQAFLYAGAADVVATLWRIEDEGAAAFAGHFYHELRRGSAPDALTRAQRALLRDTAYSAPYYWAGYRMSGAVDPANAAHKSDLVSVDLN